MNTQNTAIINTVNATLNGHRYNLINNAYHLLVDAGLTLKSGLTGEVTTNCSDTHFQVNVDTIGGDTITVMVPTHNGELKTTAIDVWCGGGDVNIMREVARRPLVNGKRYTMMLMAVEKVFQEHTNTTASVEYELKLRGEIAELTTELKEVQGGANTRLRELAAEGLKVRLEVLNERLEKALSVGK